MIFSLANDLLSAVDAEMRRVVEAVAVDVDGFATMLRYPLGWMTAEGGPYNEPTGKRVRPILLLMCAEAAGGDARKALPAAAAVELLHNFSLIHDDIQDDSPLRHGRDTVWRVWGVANAINAGDAMFTLSFAAMQRLAKTGSSAEITLRALELFTETALTLTRGQHLDMRFERQTQVSVAQYIDMISGKTAAMLGLCAQLGALIASCDDERAAHFGRFGVDLGIAFQIHDDILGIWGDEAKTGKSAASDILSRKKSLPVLYGLAQSERLAEIYAQPTDAAIDVAEVVGLLNETGALEYARDLEQDYSAKSAAALATANPEPKAAAALRALIDALFDRRS
jgi:geranylgeranyl diphosphate synthase, type I